MPNWCVTNMTFYSKDRDTLEDFLKHIEDWISTDKYSNKLRRQWFGRRWLGNVLYSVFGEKFVNEVINKEEISYRGYIAYLSDREEISYNEKLGYYSFIMDTETAWIPHIKMWKLVLDKFYPNGEIKYAYIANEPGCRVNMIWDPDYVIRPSNDYKYVIEYYNEEDGECYDWRGEILDNNTAIKIIKELFNVDCSEHIDDVDRVNREVREAFGKDEDLYFYFALLDVCETENS